MELTEFPACCGIDVLSYLSDQTEQVWINNLNGDGYGGYRPRTKIDTVNEIRDHLLDTKSEGRGLVLAVTNRKPQQLKSAKLLKAFGFKQLRKFYNPRHRSTLTMWQLAIGELTRAQIKKKAKDLCAQPAKK